MTLRRTRPRSRKKFTHIQRHTLADNSNNNKDKLKVIEHTPMTAMRITATMTTTIHTHHAQKAKAENRKV
jgi:hypothetical protein